MKYETIDKTRQSNVRKARLASLETEHLNACIDLEVAVAQMEAGVTGSPERVIELEERRRNVEIAISALKNGK